MTDKELKHSLGRLIMPRLGVDEYTSNPKYRTDIEHLVRVGKAGGFCVFGGTVTSVAETIGQLQAIAKATDDLPLLFSCDAEWGVSMRIREGTEFPHARAFAKAKDATLIEEASYRIAMELRALGIWWHFAPVADVNTNPFNPIINVRAYGETPELVIKTAKVVCKGIERANVLACAKHFPGHGNTVTDSHQDLPIVEAEASWIRANDLPPFQALIAEGIPSIMTGHIAAPQLAARYGASKVEALLPATISRALTTELLRKELKFDGIIVTDSLEMGGIRKVVHKTAELTRQVLAAGADVLLMPPDPIETHAAIWRSLDSDELDHGSIAASIDRVRMAVTRVADGETPSIQETFTRSRTKALAIKVAEKAIKTRGDLSSMGEASDIFILCSDRRPDVEKAMFCKETWESMGIKQAISVLSDTKGNSTDFPENPIIVTFDRPHGVLGGAAHQNSIENVVRKVLHAFVRTGISPSGVILIGNPYLEKIFEQVEPGCGILTYSATEPSIIAVGNILKNAQ